MWRQHNDKWTSRRREKTTTAWTMESSWFLMRWAGFEYFFHEMGKTNHVYWNHRYPPGGDASHRVQRAGAGGHLRQARLSPRLQQHRLPHHRHSHRGELFILRQIFQTVSSLCCLSLCGRALITAWAQHNWKCIQVRLEDQVCEECKEGRTKLRPGLVQVSLKSYLKD